jgi:hypothetical protein
MIGVELTDEDAVLFRLFREHQTNFEKMVEMGVFEKDNIQVTLFFNKFSSLTAIDKTKRVTLNNKKRLQVAQRL